MERVQYYTSYGKAMPVAVRVGSEVKKISHFRMGWWGVDFVHFLDWSIMSDRSIESADYIYPKDLSDKERLWLSQDPRRFQKMCYWLCKSMLNRILICQDILKSKGGDTLWRNISLILRAPCLVLDPTPADISELISVIEQKIFAYKWANQDLSVIYDNWFWELLGKLKDLVDEKDL